MMRFTAGALIALAGLLAVGGAVYVMRKKGAAVVDALNPASENNLAYRGVNALGSFATGDDHFTLGGFVYDQTHEDNGGFDYSGAVGLGVMVAMPGVYGIGKITGISDMDYSFLNPASDKNIVYGGVNSIGAKVSGDKDWSLGGWLYEVTH